MRTTFLSIALFLFSLASPAQDAEMGSMLHELATTPPDTSRVNLLKSLGNNIAAQEPRKAIDFWKEAIDLVRQLNFERGLTRCYINISTGYSYLGKLDSAVIYSDTAIAYCRKLGEPSLLSLAYLNRADNYANLHNSKKAILYCDTALTYAAKTQNIDRLARIYTILGNVYSEQQQYPVALKYLRNALPMFRKNNNIESFALTLSCIAEVLNSSGQYDSAMKYYADAIMYAEQAEDFKNLANYNLEVSALLQDRGKVNEAKPYVQKAMVYAKQQGNNLQLAAAYSHLCHIETEEGNYVDAIRDGKLSYDYAVQESELGIQQQTATFLSNAYSKHGDFKDAYNYLKIARTASDSVIKQQYDSEIRTIQNTFEIAQKDKEISLLNKDFQLQQQRIRQQRYVLIGSIIFAVLALGAIVLLISRYRLRQRMKELELRNSIAADLHDEVGSSLSSIHLLSQVAANQEGVSTANSDILSRVSTNARETIDKISDIVWMIKPGENEGASLSQRMERFIYEMCTSRSIDCALTGAEHLEHVKMTMQQRKNFFLVFKEALNNAVKYSDASRIVVKVEQEHKQLRLTVRDEGKGFAITSDSKGNGLSNMKSRAKDMGGKLDIQSVKGEGTEIKLVIPLG